MKQLEQSGKHYETLDRKLATALHKLQTGEFGRRVNVMKRRIMRKEGHRLLCGRQILWMLNHYYRTNRNLGHIHSIVDLTRILWKGDGHLSLIHI